MPVTASILVKELIASNPATRCSRALKQHLFSLLQSCNNVEALPQIHTQIIINGFTQKNYILVKLLYLYITSGNLIHAHKVFEKIENPSTTIWNQILRGNARSETPEKSVELYKQMVERESQPDEFTYSFLLSACARCGLFKEGEQVHTRVLASGYCSNVHIRTNLMNLYLMGGEDTGVAYARRVFDDMLERNVVSWNSLLKGYVRCGDIDGALRVFDEMPQRNVVSWTTMISGCARNGKCKRALSLFGEMRRAAHVRVDQVALLAVLSACAELGDLNLGKWIHSYVEETLCVESGTILITLNNALIHMYASCGEIEEAYEVFRKMRRRSIVSWTSMITGFAKQGYAQETLVLFEWMQNSTGENEVKPDEISFLGVLCACSHGGFIEEGRQFFQRMKQSGIKPKIEHYGCMIDLLSRAGFLEEACSLVQNMPMKPNDAVWGSLLLGCRIHNNTELASQVAQKLVAELESDQYGEGYLVLLTNVYATSKRWPYVAAVRQKMIDMGVRKTPGRSWVKINGVFHDFLAGDTTHKHASLIYKTIGDITLNSMWEGCKPDILYKGCDKV